MAPEERTVATTAAVPTEIAAAAGVQTQLLDTVSWGGVFAGTAVALVAQITLSLVGIGIGAGAIDPGTTNSPSADSFSTGAAVWWLISAIVSVGAGAYVAGRLSGRPRASTGGWHGLITWALTTLLTLTVLSSAVGGVVGGTLRGAAGVASQLSAEDQALVQGLMSGDPQAAQQAREQAAERLSEARGIPQDQALEQVRQFEQQFLNSGSVQNFAQQSTAAISRVAWLGALAMVLGGVTSWFAGRAGTMNLSVRLPSASPRS